MRQGRLVPGRGLFQRHDRHRHRPQRRHVYALKARNYAVFRHVIPWPCGYTFASRLEEDEMNTQRKESENTTAMSSEPRFAGQHSPDVETERAARKIRERVMAEI